MWRRRCGLVAAAALVTVLTAAPAAAVGPGSAGPGRADAVSGTLAFTVQNCESFGRRVFCVLAFTGGVAPFTIRWTVNGAPDARFNDSRTLSIPCAVPSVTQVSVVVADAVGDQIGFGRSVRCITGFP